MVTRTDDFLAIIISDQDWVRAEFEAIIGAEWPDSPAEFLLPVGFRRLGGRPWLGLGREPQPLENDSPAEAWIRERSPPVSYPPPMPPNPPNRKVLLSISCRSMS
ncbi:MAG: hypothetical protein JWM76_750 [Pseudonocardiales bacterium]|nr:hypothetical protein [Pseudonocardiales bacterium]